MIFKYLMGLSPRAAVFSLTTQAREELKCTVPKAIWETINRR